MDQDTLRKLVIYSSPRKLADAMSGLSEKERRALSTYANKLRVDIFRGKLDKEITDITLDAVLGKLNPKKTASDLEYDIRFKSQLAVIGLSSLTNARRIDFWSLYNGNEKILDQVVRERKPEWLTELVTHDLEKEFGRFNWELIYSWIKDGLCEPIDTAGYYEQFSIAFHGWKYKEEDKFIPISTRLAAQPELLENEVWGLFRYYTLSFQNDWHEGNPHSPDNYESWPTALNKLSQQGLLDKSRLLDESLAALDREFENHIKSGFHKFHVLLEPGIEEITQRKQSYLNLLSQPVGHIVNFSIKMLRQLEKANVLTLDEILSHASPVMALSSKTQPSAILKMVKRLAAKSDHLNQKQVELCLHALPHESKDVQELAITLLEGIKQSEPEVTIDSESYIDFLHPALKSRLQALTSAESVIKNDESFQQSLQQEWQDAISQIKKLGNEQRHQLGLNDYKEETFTQRFPPPMTVSKTFDVLEEAGIIKPIETVNDLILEISHAVEVVDSADDVERILDGISRLCDQRPDDFELRTEALRKRISEQDYAESAKGLVSGYNGITSILKDLLHTWLTGQLHKEIATNYGVHEFIEERIQSIAVRVAKRIAAPLLSAPTHQHGWIEPLVFVTRVLDWQAKELALDRYDLIQGLLRLTYTGREQALEQAAQIDQRYAGNIIRWALGAENGPDATGIADTDLWIIANCVRLIPGTIDKELAPLQIKEHIPDTSLPAIYSWKPDTRTVKGYGDSTYTFPVLRIEVETSANDKEKNESKGIGKLFNKIKEKVIEKNSHALSLKQLPTSLLTWFSRKNLYENANYSSSWLINWSILTWPANIDGSMARAARHYVNRIDEKGSSYEPNYAFLEPVFLKDKNWSEMVRLALWNALSSMDADAKGVAIDLLIHGIEDGRAHPEPLSDTLIQLSKGGWIKLNRLSTSLSQVSEVSDLHKMVCLRILEPFLEQLADNAKNSHMLMELMQALYIDLGLQPGSALQENLRRIKGASKKAKAAKALLSIVADERNIHRKQAILQAVEARINRVKLD